MGSISPLKWKIDLPQTYFFNFETKAPEIVQEIGQHLLLEWKSDLPQTYVSLLKRKRPK